MLKLFSVVVAMGALFPSFTFAKEISVGEQLSEGGIALIVILLLSVLFLSVTIERLVNFREKNIFSDGLTDRIKPLWSTKERSIKEIELIHDQLKIHPSILAQVLEFIVNNRHQSFDFVTRGASEIASLELRKHQQKLYPLSIIATVAPILGLLGTVVGMIEAFHVIAYSQGMGNPALLAGGISKALINTAAGLGVALPALGMHHFFKYRSTHFGLVLEQEINQFINAWFLPPHIDHFDGQDEKSVEVAYAN